MWTAIARVFLPSGLARRLARSARARRVMAWLSAVTYIGLGLFAALTGERARA